MPLKKKNDDDDVRKSVECERERKRRKRKMACELNTFKKSLNVVKLFFFMIIQRMFKS